MTRGRQTITVLAVLGVVLLNIGLLTSTVGGVHTPSRSVEDLTMRSLVERQLVTHERRVYVELRENAPESAYRIAEDAAAFRGGRARLWLSGIAQARSWRFDGPRGECTIDDAHPPILAGTGRFFDWALHLPGDGQPADVVVVRGRSPVGAASTRPFLLIVDAALERDLSCNEAPA